MEFLDNIILPQSGSNLALLEFLLMMAKLIFVLYTGVLFGSVLLSIYFQSKTEHVSNYKYIYLSKNYIDLITTNKLMGFGLGIIPFMAIIFLYAHLLHNTQTAITLYLFYSFILFIPGLILIYSYKHSLHLKDFLYLVKKAQNIRLDADGQQELIDYNISVSKLNVKTGWWGLLLLFVSLWMFNSAADLAVDKVRWASEPSLLDIMIYGTAILRFMHFITAAFSLTGVAFIIKIFYWDRAVYQYSEEYEDFAKKINVRIAMVFACIQPVFLIINLILTPKIAVSNFIYGIGGLVFVCVFFALHYLYETIRYRRYKFIIPSFYLLLTIFAFIILKDQNAFNVSNKEQKARLATLFEEYQSQFKAVGTEEMKINGEELYKGRCTACHRFEEKLVGPAHKDVLPKYINNKEALIKFIMNPVKVDPNYPPMPNQGLKPAEAKAIADFMLEHYGPQLK